MADACDITTVDEAAWNEAVARELVLRRLAGQERLNRAEVVQACRELGVRRARLVSGDLAAGAGSARPDRGVVR